jgi:hypothetical protein
MSLPFESRWSDWCVDWLNDHWPFRPFSHTAPTSQQPLHKVDNLDFLAFMISSRHATIAFAE